MNLTITRPSTVPARDRRRSRTHRLQAIIAAAASSALAWLIVVVGFGKPISGPTFDAAPPTEVGIGSVVAAVIVSGLAGWALLAVLERWTSRPELIWTAIAVVITLVSLGGPLSGSGVSRSDRVALVVLHLITAGVYIPLVRRTIAESDQTA